MKQTRFAITLVACLLGLVGMAQNTVVEGTKLNIGENNTVTGTISGAIGQYNIVGANNALAVGYGDTINGLCPNSLAVGTANRVGGSSSFAMGQDVKVMYSHGLGIGRFLKVMGEENCMVIGSGFPGSGLKPKRFLENEYGHSLMIGFKSIHPTLTVGPSPNDYPQGDTLCKTGKVAIGDVPVPDIAAKLHIRSDYGEDAGIFLENKDLENSNSFIRLKDEDHVIKVDNDGELTLSSLSGTNLGSLVLNGRVGINITNESDTYVLAVNGGVLTDEVFIKNVEEWFDHVFAKDYKLMSLHDLHSYINTNGHLPEVPAETEVLEEGYNLGEMQGILLKKIEELTLYTIEQQQQIERLEQRINELEGK
jgi:hypothetical protein